MTPSIMRLYGYGSIVKYQPRDYPIIKEWYKRRGTQAPKRGILSDLGYIVDGRVAAWLYLTNGNVAMIEGIISDPHTVPSLRRASTKKLVGFLIDTAMMLGYTNIMGCMKHPNVEKLAKEFGFKEAKDFKLYILSTEVEDK